MRETLQIMAIGDVHARLDALAFALASASCSGERYDLVACSGDFAGHFAPPGTKSFEGATKTLYRATTDCALRCMTVLDTPVVYSPGNHDVRNIDGPGDCVPLDAVEGRPGREFGGWKLFGIGGSPRTPGSFSYEWDDSMVEGVLEARLEGGDSTVWLSHSPPYGCHCDESGPHREHIGSVAIRSMIKKLEPRVVICGHVHEGAGCDTIGRTLIVNLGAVDDYRPLRARGRQFTAQVFSYFSIVLDMSGNITVANFMYAPSGAVAYIHPNMWHHDGNRLVAIKPPEGLGERAWMD
jgi:Icc-related predicted phosphoesterase